MSKTQFRPDGLYSLPNGEEMMDVPIVAVSAHVGQQYRANALGAGMTDFVTKPLDFDCLDELLGSLVEAKQPV